MKKKNLKRLCALGLTGVMSASMLAGCGGSGDSNGGGESKDGVPTLVWWLVGGTTPDGFDDMVSKISDYSEEKIGVRVDIKIAGYDNYDSKSNTIANAGEYFDIMFVNNTNYGKFVNLGILEDITESVKTEAPDLYEFIPEDLWDGVTYKGGIYAVPTYKDSSLTQFWYLDDAMVQKYGIDYEGVTTMDQLGDIFKTLKEGENNPSYYPCMLDQGALWNGFFNEYDGLAAGLQPMGVKIDDASRKVINVLEQDDIKHNLELLHEWYQAGYINPDANVLTESSKGHTFGNAQGWPAAVSQWQDLQGIEKYDAWKVFGPIYTTETIQGSMNAISANSKYKTEALKLLELVNTDKTFRDMLAYGIEGETFEYTEEGRVEKLTDTWSIGNYTIGTYFNLSGLADADPAEYDQIKQQNEEATQSVCLGFAFDSEPVQNELASCKTVWDKYKYDLLTGASDPSEVLPKVTEELKAQGFEKVMEEAQKQLDEFFK